MSKKTLVTTFIIQSVCWFSIIWFLSGNNIVEARYLLQIATPQPFVGSIYYGQKSVWQVFDHNFPNDGQENNYVVHYDGTQHNPATNTPAAPGATPVPGEWIRNGYGYDDHVGIDYGLIYQPVLAAASGFVETAGWSNPANHRAGYGLHVVMDHPDNAGYETWYGHLSSLTVQTGDEISIENLANPGDRRRVLGISGNTGNVFGPGNSDCWDVELSHTCGYHLHFEVRQRQNGYFVNPYGWIAAGIDGTPTPDPWVTRSNAISYDLWATPPAVTSSQYQANGPILPTPTLPTPYITVDNADSDPPTFALA